MRDDHEHGSYSRFLQGRQRNDRGGSLGKFKRLHQQNRPAKKPANIAILFVGNGLVIRL